MELNYFKLSLVENTTVIITDPVPRDKYSDISRRVMSHTHLAAEQVGFFSRYSGENADYKLEMAGGEFCGNAVLAAGALAGFKKIKKNKIYFAVSGTEKVLEVNYVSRGSKNWRVRSTMPVENKVKKSTLGERNGYLVGLEGIVHFLYEDGSLHKDSRNREEKRQQKMLKELASREKRQAYGVIPYIKEGEEYFIRPCVYVPETGSIVFERGCGSGTVALGIILASVAGSSVSCSVGQPGGIIEVEIEVLTGVGGEKEIEKVWITAGVDLTCRGSVYV
ncbi:MAG: hypothetical protein ACOC5A_05935 [Halanaerobiales bacterium]